MIRDWTKRKYQLASIIGFYNHVNDKPSFMNNIPEGYKAYGYGVSDLTGISLKNFRKLLPSYSDYSIRRVVNELSKDGIIEASQVAGAYKPMYYQIADRRKLASLIRKANK
jgi:hypothetical protein